MKRLTLVIVSLLICSCAYGAGLDANTHLLLHMNADPFTDSSTSNNKGDATEVADVDLDEATKKWGAGSADFDGDSGYLYYADSDDWDIFANNSDNWTIDFWVRHADHAGNECYVSQYENAENRWSLWHIHGGGIQLLFEELNDIRLNISGGEITDTDWHHIAVCKVGNDFGIYKDGTQVANHDNLANFDTFTAVLSIGAYNSTDYFDGNIDEFRISKSNVFSASPEGGGDTITVPTEEYSGAGASASQIIIIK